MKHRSIINLADRADAQVHLRARAAAHLVAADASCSFGSQPHATGTHLRIVSTGSVLYVSP
jgi:hypothetical protein